MGSLPLSLSSLLVSFHLIAYSFDEMFVDAIGQPRRCARTQKSPARTNDTFCVLFLFFRVVGVGVVALRPTPSRSHRQSSRQATGQTKSRIATIANCSRHSCCWWPHAGRPEGGLPCATAAAGAA